MISHHELHDRMISRSRNLATPLARLQDLAPRLVQCLPATVGEVADRLGATRDEIEDVAAFTEDHVAHRDGRLVAREWPRESAWAAAEIYTR